MSAHVVSIWLKRFRRGPMDPVPAAELVAGEGLVGNVDQGGRRQITILAEEAWREATERVGGGVDPAARRANVLVRGLELEGTRGRLLRLGDCTILIGGETRPCERMDEAQPGLREALKPRWRGGVYGEIVTGGVVRIGDSVTLE